MFLSLLLSVVLLQAVSLKLDVQTPLQILSYSEIQGKVSHTEIMKDFIFIDKDVN